MSHAAFSRKGSYHALEMDHITFSFYLKYCHINHALTQHMTFRGTEWKEDSIQLSQQRLTDEAAKVVTLYSPQYVLKVHRQLVGHMVPVFIPRF